MANTTTEATTRSLRFFVDLMHLFTTNDSGRVVMSEDPETEHRIKGQGSTEPKKAIVVYQDPMPQPLDYYILNPYAEGLGLQTPPNAFFYSSLRAALGARLIQSIVGVLQFIQTQKGIDVKDPTYSVVGSPKCLLDAASAKNKKNKPIVDLVDDKTVAHIKHYLNSVAALKNFVYIAYTKSQMVASLRIDFLMDPDFTETHDMGKMRVADIEVLRGVLFKMFGLSDISDMSKYTAGADENAQPKMSSWLRVLYKAYRALNPILEVVDDELVVDLNEFKYHLDNLADYTGNARHMIQMSQVKTSQPHNPIPQASVTTQAPGVGGYQQASPGYNPQAAPQTVPGPMRADGTTMPPQPVYPQSQGYAPGYAPGYNSGVPAPIPAYQNPNMGMPQPGYTPPNAPGYVPAPQYTGMGGYQQPGFPPAPAGVPGGLVGSPNMGFGFGMPQGYNPGFMPPQPVQGYYGVAGLPPGVR